MRRSAVFFAWIIFSASPCMGGEGKPEGPRLESEHIAIQLESPEGGLGVSSIEHKSGGGTPETFVKAAPGSALIWRLVLRGPEEKAEEIRVDNRTPCKRSIRLDNASRSARLRWEGIPLGGEESALDVEAEVRLAEDGAGSTWRLSATNRSRKAGFWEAHFPLFSGFAEKGERDCGAQNAERQGIS